MPAIFMFMKKNIICIYIAGTILAEDFHQSGYRSKEGGSEAWQKKCSGMCVQNAAKKAGYKGHPPKVTRYNDLVICFTGRAGFQDHDRYLMTKRV
jgi:hypothetical protein